MQSPQDFSTTDAPVSSHILAIDNDLASVLFQSISVGMGGFLFGLKCQGAITSQNQISNKQLSKILLVIWHPLVGQSIQIKTKG